MTFAANHIQAPLSQPVQCQHRSCLHHVPALSLRTRTRLPYSGRGEGVPGVQPCAGVAGRGSAPCGPSGQGPPKMSSSHTSVPGSPPGSSASLPFKPPPARLRHRRSWSSTTGSNFWEGFAGSLGKPCKCATFGTCTLKLCRHECRKNRTWTSTLLPSNDSLIPLRMHQLVLVLANAPTCFNCCVNALPALPHSGQ